jgi:hypothetical protein
MSDPEIRYLGDMQRLALAPDDVLVLMCDEHLSDQEAIDLRKRLQGVFGAGRTCIVLSHGMKLGAIGPAFSMKEPS